MTEEKPRSTALLIDIGNTRIKWVRQQDRQYQTRGAMDHIKRGLPAKLLKEWQTQGQPDQVVACNVCGQELTDRLIEWVKNTWDLDVDFIEPRQRAFGVRNGYVEPTTLGCDRWANLLAAWQSYRKPLCVVDCGTAMTIDAVDENGSHIGGLIIPGLRMMTSALGAQTRGLNAATLDQPGQHPNGLLAGDTNAAVQGGVLYATVATIDRIFADICGELGAPCLGLLTGGDAERVLPLLRADFQHEPDLIFKGMSLLVKDR